MAAITRYPTFTGCFHWQPTWKVADLLDPRPSAALVKQWRRGRDSNPRDPAKGLTVFETAPIDHSGTSPYLDWDERRRGWPAPAVGRGRRLAQTAARSQPRRALRARFPARGPSQS